MMTKKFNNLVDLIRESIYRSSSSFIIPDFFHRLSIAKESEFATYTPYLLFVDCFSWRSSI